MSIYLGPDSQQDRPPSATSGSAQSTVACVRCGRVDASLRGASFMYAASVVLVTFTGGAAAGIYCSSCRRKMAAMYSVLSAIVGWWGIPWGPIRTIHAIGRNCAGGFQDRNFNADLLRSVARELIERDDMRGAAEALQASLNFRDEPALRETLWHLAGEATQEISATGTTVHAPGDLVTSAGGGVLLRAAPGAAHEAVGVLDDDAVVTRADRGWVELRVLGGGSGWAPANEVEAVR